MAKRPRRGGGGGGGGEEGEGAKKTFFPTSRTKSSMSESEIKARQAECRGVLEALNAQFCAHICEQKERNLRRSWVEGCQDYVKHVRKLMVSARSLCFVLSFVGGSSRFSLSLSLFFFLSLKFTHSLTLSQTNHAHLPTTERF